MKAREFWIDDVSETIDGCFDAQVYLRPPGPNEHSDYHVIEASALEAKDAEIKRLREALEEIKRLNVNGKLVWAREMMANLAREALANEPVGSEYNSGDPIDIYSICEHPKGK